jgi:ketosteroid isomerase-like protein
MITHSTMRRNHTVTLVLAIVASASVPIYAAAQNWTPEQLEIWEFETQCWQAYQDKDLEAHASCFHPDYIGWFAPDPAPMPVSESVHRHYINANREVAFNLTPHAIIVRGDIAIVHLSGFEIQIQPDGSDKVAWYHWTDIVLRENGKLSWIADHGHVGTEY